ncbi:spore germination receptor subunit [Ruminococcaceae bacterium BL-4]|nr:spore germination receptor subunit [Ruminococcaceae bacterium BL-4]
MLMILQNLLKKIKYRTILNEATKNVADSTPESKNESSSQPTMTTSLKDNIEIMKSYLGDCNDVKIREFTFGRFPAINAALIFIDGLVSNDIITEGIMKPLMLSDARTKGNVIEDVQKRIICSGDVINSDKEDKLLESCLCGDTVLLIDGYRSGIIISSKGWDKRSVTEPQTEAVTRGPREGFTENFRTNTSLLRRKIRNPAFRMDTFVIGEKTRTIVSVAYLKGVADESLIAEVKRRLNSINVDSILESGYIEQYIEDAPFSIFPTIGKSEKPDVVAGKILEGRAAIIVDGTPFVLTVPMLFTESFQTAEDYYARTFYSSILRLLRFLSFTFAVFGPAFFIAITTFHQELIPTTLMFTIATAREGTPFPTAIEALILLLAFEILREAGLRLPRPIGQAVSIVGALVMGDAAVSAGLVGAPMVVTVAISAMAEFVTPEHQDAIIVLRLVLLVLSATLGGFGISLGTLWMLIDLASLKSFGVPFFAGVAPMHIQDWKDLFIRAPLWTMKKRPPEFAHQDITRQQSHIPPGDTTTSSNGDAKS